MSKQQITLLSLQAELKNFGLNPSDWTLHRVNALRFVLQNNLDANFLMRGRLEYKKQKAQWKSLELLSL